jgi:hypothetical protein
MTTQRHDSPVPLRSVIAGIIACLVAIVVAAIVLFAYGRFLNYAKVDYIDARYSRDQLKAVTIVVIAICVTLPVIAGCAVARLLHAHARLVCTTAFLLFAGPAWFGLILLSEINACDGVGSYPIPGHYVGSCGR